METPKKFLMEEMELRACLMLMSAQILHIAATFDEKDANSGRKKVEGIVEEMIEWILARKSKTS
jgi:hypothetical protein